MYIKKILLFIVLLSLIGGGIFSYSIYTKVFNSNTAFAEETQVVYIPSGATFKDAVKEVQPAKIENKDKKKKEKTDE